ncbi:polysaccharide deacetylase family protein [Cupriavidus sp. WKF15]|uniref:polysaccharide deacetylase family protein n=1 Tax=Cupriavidus sp. WKF15 TaxID=3032282 RepID=UPI0023E28532|nr:polysaccharide deacetylase family protein [Cupriavidus sp. WKF15]WER50143.1 polysaccharide deacetylase family protein [Cupriavidus sp. WKF15]
MLQRISVVALLSLVLSAPALTRAATNQIALVVPDNFNQSDPHITAWLDAALEEGLQITLVTDTQVIQGVTPTQFPGMILPDLSHPNASDDLVTAIQNYTNQGGNVMLVYDFGALTTTGFYAPQKSRFSNLAGVDYVLYDQLLGNMIGLGPVTGLSSTLRAIQVPPGKSMAWTTTTSTNPIEGISGYVYGFLTYPSYVTQGTYSGTTMLTSPNFGLVAGLRPYGAGQVLFVNLPLTYLKGQTDGMAMHGFVRYFGETMMRMPRLSAQPKAVGGLVLNFHFCAGDEIAPALKLQSWGIFNNGPFSVAITAGPDQAAFGDGLGIDLSRNTTAQQLVQYLLGKGHHIGNHGGWIHDYWGANASETNASNFTQYLVLNKQSVEAVTQQPTVEYAAPEGNTPQWSIDWLEANGNTGYYFTGHTGMAPTRSYRNGALLNQTIRAFPVMPFGLYATFEEFQQFSVPTSSVSNWYSQLTNFVVKNRTSRLIYMHPLGASAYHGVLNSIFTQATTLHTVGQFNWYTMDDLAKFGQRRQQTAWQATDTGNAWSFQATNAAGLTDLTWVLPKAAYNQPVVTQGVATVTWDLTNWLITAGAGTSLAFTSGKH